ncbi:hypothetical protein HYU40_00085 [Candidatus Woesearchaeota archaeon]|nr:hypothetical protein [Candidatus Woesearchaeota archaeon]
MKRFSISPIVYDWIFWISIGVVVVWMILKATGIIHSPIWQELLPFAGGLAAIVSYFQKTGRYLEKIDHLDRDFHEFRSKADIRFDEVKADLHKYDNRLIRIEARLS